MSLMRKKDESRDYIHSVTHSFQNEISDISKKVSNCCDSIILAVLSQNSPFCAESDFFYGYSTCVKLHVFFNLVLNIQFFSNDEQYLYAWKTEFQFQFNSIVPFCTLLVTLIR